MTIVDEHGRPEPLPAADEATTLLGFLDYQRATLAWRCSDLDAGGLRSTVAASSVTLGGLLSHMALVEDHWFGTMLHTQEPNPPWDTIDWDADPDADWHLADTSTPDELHALWHDAVERSHALTAEATDDGGLDRLADRGWSDGTRMSLRWILVHMVEEYARHNGHADLLRESIDGVTGE